MKTIRVTDFQYEQIKDENKKHKERNREIRFRIRALKIASDYYLWIRKNKSGSSFSAFCDNFGYEYKDEKRMYDMVLYILENLGLFQ